MMQLSRLVLLFIFILVATPSTAQIEGRLEVGKTCSVFGESVPKEVTLFESEPEAEEVVSQILSVAGLVKNFKVRAAGVPNAAAVVRGTNRFILYDPYFMRTIRKQTSSKWAAISIMAHEIGHHLNGHTLDQEGSRPDKELEADYFSGFVLEKLGASLDEARTAMNKLGSANASTTHPAKNDRLVAIARGWSKSCNANPKCEKSESTTTQGEPTEPQDPPAKKPPKKIPKQPAPDPGVDVGQQPGLPSGTPLANCDCWGFDNGQPKPHSACQSGYAIPQICPGFCPAGGSPWRGICM